MKNKNITSFYLPNGCYVNKTRNGWYSLLIPAAPNCGQKVWSVKTSRKPEDCTAHYHMLDVKGLLNHQRVHA